MNLDQLKEELNSLSKIIYFDQNDYLREKTSNPTKLMQLILDAEKVVIQLSEDELKNQDTLYFLYGTLGNLYRIYGEPGNAIYYLQLALEQSVVNKNSKQEIVSLIRLGETFKYDNKHKEALDFFQKALLKSRSVEENSYLDFIYQHQGKCFLEMGKVEEALNYLEQALEIRKIKGDDSLIHSTEQAIELRKRV
ncbi:tetratricopeptide repeat protein [Bacillus sp. RG28]|uniref:Tetratricopeptide repeat protein n=1 Tax=Gottfriedia endophytica TaxID=2820819 RepID=A0A940NNA8_9BACI|nr:tetratricopeptide repeat protein [Gottfriedia endophytica]MBP0725294.1 tetratricopeptide repeat protein [Gottfriedia endophytica]